MSTARNALGEYEESLVEAQRLYRRVVNAQGGEREAAQREYDAALRKAREVAARLSAAN